jgi:hypothetical protein
MRRSAGGLRRTIHVPFGRIACFQETCMRPLLPLVLCTALAGCATTGVDKLERLRPGFTVALFSLMGDHLAVRDVGARAMHDYRGDVDVRHWHIDRHAESVAGKVVGDTGKFRIVQADTELLRRTAKLKDDPWTGGTRMQASSGSVAAFAKQSAADYVLVIGPASMGDPFLGSDEQLSGYGIYQRSLRITQPAFVGLKRAFSFLAMKVMLLDGKSGEAIARAQCALGAPRQESQHAVRPDEGARADIETLVEAALRKCLGTLKLA